MNDRVDTIISGRRERLQKLLLRPLDHPESDRDEPLADDTRQHLLEYAEDLYWNELEWENITEEEVTGHGPVSQLVFPGFLAFVRGLLLEEAIEDAKAPADPQPEVVQGILRFLAERVVELEETLDQSDVAERSKVRDELDVTDHLLELVLYRYHDLSEAEIERMEESRGGRQVGS